MEAAPAVFLFWRRNESGFSENECCKKGMELKGAKINLDLAKRPNKQLFLPSIFINFIDDWIDWKSLLLAGGAALSFSSIQSSIS